MKPGFHPEPEVEERRQLIAAAYETALALMRNAQSEVLREYYKECAEQAWTLLYLKVGSAWSRYVVAERKARSLC